MERKRESFSRIQNISWGNIFLNKNWAEADKYTVDDDWEKWSMNEFMRKRSECLEVETKWKLKTIRENERKKAWDDRKRGYNLQSGRKRMKE